MSDGGCHNSPGPLPCPSILTLHSAIVLEPSCFAYRGSSQGFELASTSASQTPEGTGKAATESVFIPALCPTPSSLLGIRKMWVGWGEGDVQCCPCGEALMMLPLHRLVTWFAASSSTLFLFLCVRLPVPPLQASAAPPSRLWKTY